MSLLSEQIDKHLASAYVGFHSPAHNGSVSKRDLTELDGLDNLQYPNEVLYESQRIIADLFGAAHSYFLLNGATIGLHAACLALKKYLATDTRPVLLARNVHKSVIAGIILADLKVEWLEPSWSEDLGVYTRVDLKNIENKYSAVIITNPTYEGFYSIVPELDIPIIIDEAHGSHYHFSDKFPKPALVYGADIVIQSWHKCLGSLTQTGVAHVSKNSKIPACYFEEALRLLHTTSPSYILMESLTNTTTSLLQQGVDQFTKLLKIIAEFGFNSFNDDPLRYLIKGNGIKIEQQLKQHKILVEAAYANFALLFMNIGHSAIDLSRLQIALLQLEHEVQQPLAKLVWGKQELPIREAYYAQSRLVRKGAALNKISAELYAVCPPGIAVLVPGQVLTESVIDLVDKEYIAVID